VARAVIDHAAGLSCGVVAPPRFAGGAPSCGSRSGPTPWAVSASGPPAWADHVPFPGCSARVRGRGRARGRRMGSAGPGPPSESGSFASAPVTTGRGQGKEFAAPGRYPCPEPPAWVVRPCRSEVNHMPRHRSTEPPPGHAGGAVRWLGRPGYPGTGPRVGRLVFVIQRVGALPGEARGSLVCAKAPPSDSCGSKPEDRPRTWVPMPKARGVLGRLRQR
jgi:hypothetical protein